MLVLLSPAKTFNSKDALPFSFPTRQPNFLTKTATLVTKLQQLKANDLAKLLSISDKLADTNYQRYQNWEAQATESNGRPAAFAFWGDVNKHFNAFTLSAEQLAYADQHVLFLSGLYGVLKPLDFIQEYRLEMGIPFASSKDCKDLYSYWKPTLVDYFNHRIAEEKIEFICNLASKEYYSVVDFKKLNCPTVEIIFKEQKNGKYKVISVIAKRSRGMMARWIVENQIRTAEQLKNFNVDGYYFVEAESNEQKFTFYRDEQ